MLRDPPLSISRQKSKSAQNWELQEEGFKNRTSNIEISKHSSAMTTTTRHALYHRTNAYLDEYPLSNDGETIPGTPVF